MNNPFLIMILSVIIAAFSQVLLKRSASGTHNSIIKEYLNGFVICGYFMLLVSTLLTIHALRSMEYKNLPVIEALGYFFVLVLSRFLLKEKMSKRKILGNVMIIAGIIIFYL